jgi:GT2 family glycosyltransferase
MALWKYAQGRTCTEILAGFDHQGLSPDLLRAALACLAEGGLLERENLDHVEPGQPAPGLSAEVPQSIIVDRPPWISVIIVGYKSRSWLEECLSSLTAQAYRPVEVVVVDNGLLDDTVEWLTAHFTQCEDFTLQVLGLETPVSFARAVNLGVSAAQGDYLLMLNPDVRVAHDAIYAALQTALTHAPAEARAGIVALKLRLWWAPKFLNGLGNRVGAFSWGTDNALGHLDLGQFDHWQEVPSACFAAALIGRSTWEAVGSVDEQFPMYYEDSEWSYRARLIGHPVWASPAASVYHAFGVKAPADAYQPFTSRKRSNITYGRLRFALKLAGKRMATFLRNYLLEDWANLVILLVRGDFSSARAIIAAWQKIYQDWFEIRATRRALQSQRYITDEELFRVSPEIPQTFAWHGMPELTWDLIEHHYYPLILHGKTRPMPEFNSSPHKPRLLVISNDVVDVKMAGPGMRYLEMSRALSTNLDVTLAVPGEIGADFARSLETPSLHVARYDEQRADSLQPLVENAEIALISGYMVEKFPFLENTTTRLVVDMYNPFVLENLHYYLQEPLENQNALNAHAVRITNQLAKIGDYFICGNERQRDYWLGVLTANGRTNPQNFMHDPTLTRLIDIVSIGFSNRPPRPGQGLAGVHPAIPSGSRIVLWGGGVWNWLDPLTLIQAWPDVAARYPEARLVFLGTRHPNPLVPQHEMAQKAIKLAEEIGEKDKSIVFIEWVSYEEREALLCEAEVGVTLHPIHVETRFSLRTRVLDCFWADLPVLITEGDITSEWIQQYGLGEVVPPHDPRAVTQALLRILARPKAEWKPAFAPLKTQMTWQAVVEPLRRYCLEGGYAPDRTARGATGQPLHQPSTLRWAISRLFFLLRTEGWRTMLHRGWRFIQWKLSNLR